MRSETQLQTWPSYSGSGCVVSRNWIVSPSSSITSAFAYSLKRSGQLSMSIIRSQTKSRGALIDDLVVGVRCHRSSLLLGEPLVHVLDAPAPTVVISSASSSGIVKPYSCWIASWISTNASESSPMFSNVASGSSTTFSSGRPTRSTRMRLTSSNVNVWSPLAPPPTLVTAANCGRASDAERGQLLLGRLAAGGRGTGPPGRSRASSPGPKRGVTDDVGRAPRARSLVSSCDEVHHLEQRVEHARAGGAGAAPRAAAWPGHAASVSRLIRFTETVTSAPSSITAPVGHRHDRQAVDQPVPVALVRREHPGERGRGDAAPPRAAPRAAARARGRSRSTVMIASGIAVSSNVRPPVVSRRMRCISVEPGRLARAARS